MISITPVSMAPSGKNARLRKSGLPLLLLLAGLFAAGEGLAQTRYWDGPANNTTSIESGEGDSRWRSADYQYGTDESTVLAGEVVRTESDLTGTGHGARIELRHASGDTKAQAQVQRTDRNFQNPSASTAAGRLEVIAQGEHRIQEDLRVRSQVNFDRSDTDDASPVTRQSAVVALQKRFNSDVVGEIGVRYGNQTISNEGRFDYGSVGNPAVSSSGTLITQASSERNAESSLGLLARVTSRLPFLPGAEVFGEAEQDLQYSDRHTVAVGGSYALSPQTRVYARQDLIASDFEGDSSLERRSTTVVGIDSSYMSGGRIFNEYRYGVGDSRNAVGVRNGFKLGNRWYVTGGFEHTQVTGGTQGNATALSLGLEYTGDSWRAALAAESRHARDSRSQLLSAGLNYRLDGDWSLLARTVVTQTQDDSDHLQARQQIGFAWRPVDSDRLNGLLRFENRYESLSRTSIAGGTLSQYGSYGATLPGTYRTQIVTGLLNFNPVRGSVLTGRFAFKQNRLEDDISRSTYRAQLVHLRYTRDLTADWDIGVQAGVLLGSGGVRQSTFGIEAGYQMLNNLWLSVGHNIVGLNAPDLVGVNYTRAGSYLRLRFKFDETGFGRAASGLSHAN